MTGSIRTDIKWIRDRLSAWPARRLENGCRRRAAVALLLRPVGPDNEALFILRAEHPRDPWSGHMGLPGGRVDDSDVSCQAAVEREVYEELEIDLSRSARLIARFDEVTTSARGRVDPLIITPFVFELTEDVIPRPNDEVQRVYWVAVSELLRPVSTGTHRYRDGDNEVLLPCFRVEGRSIWGLTYQIVTRLFEALQWRVGAL